MNKLIALAFTLSLVACVESEKDGTGGPVEVDPTATFAVIEDRDDACDIIPDSEICAIGCDNELVRDMYVPEGQCIAFLCTREDGSPVLVGGCH